MLKLQYVFFSILFLTSLTGCFKGESVDLIIFNARIHTMNDQMDVFDAMAIKDGKIVELGAERKILNQYSSSEEIDAQGRDVYPGFIDAHGHILSYAKQKLGVDLTGCGSMDEVLVRIERYAQKYQPKVIVGRGWDQSLWENDSFPTNEKLSKLFPKIPVALTRIDGHAMLVNEYLLELAKIDLNTSIDGGILVKENGKLTGLVTDNVFDTIQAVLPNLDQKELGEKIKEVQNELFQYGIVGVHEAGMEFHEIELIKKLIDEGTFHINLYGMLLPTEENIAFAKKNGHYQYKNLLIRSFKVYGDGSLGSRGAFLKKEYSDLENHRGILLTEKSELNRIANLCLDLDYQMNTHAIGDSSNRIVLELCKRAFEFKPDHRWRIEHAQIVDPSDIPLFGAYGVIPSVQPTHAVTDQRWVVDRIGQDRLDGAYAYKSLLSSYGLVAIGTDFPYENLDPFRTIYAATKRKNVDGEPSNGFQSNESISLDQCLKGMTIWAAIASFQEETEGVLAKGRNATFALFEKPVRVSNSFEPNFALYTYINGKKVYSAE